MKNYTGLIVIKLKGIVSLNNVKIHDIYLLGHTQRVLK